MFVEKLNELEVQHLARKLCNATLDNKKNIEIYITSCTQYYSHLNIGVSYKTDDDIKLNYVDFKLNNFKCFKDGYINQEGTAVLREFLEDRFTDYKKVLDYYVENDLSV